MLVFFVCFFAWAVVKTRQVPRTIWEKNLVNSDIYSNMTSLLVCLLIYLYIKKRLIHKAIHYQPYFNMCISVTTGQDRLN